MCKRNLGVQRIFRCARGIFFGGGGGLRNKRGSRKSLPKDVRNLQNQVQFQRRINLALKQSPKPTRHDVQKEECNQKVKEDLLNELIVVELEPKARSLHEDITNHWILRELAWLQNLIDHPNEKGWRKELFEYLERKELLQTPSEQSRLPQKVQKVIADVAGDGAVINGISASEIFKPSNLFEYSRLL